MSATLKLGTDGNWAAKKGSVLSYNDENNNFKPLPFNFTRNSGATRVNKEGLIEVVSNNEPRIDFKDSNEGALLLEPTRTNVLPYSNNLTTWNGAAMTSTFVDDLINPSNVLGGTKLTQTSSGGYAWLSRTFTGNETFSAFVKKDSSNFARLYAANNTVYFDIVNGTIETEVGSDITDKSIIDYGNGWFRISISVNSTAASYVRIYPSSSGSSSSGTNSLFVYGAQLERGSYATSYIPTSGGVVTRDADVCNNGGNEQVINSTEGVFYVEAAKTNESEVEGGIFLSRDRDNEIRMNFATNNRLNVFVNVGGSYQVYMDNTNYNLEEYNKIAIKYKLNDYSVFVNGNKILTDTNATVPSGLNLVDFNQFYGNVKEIKLYNEALTDAELAALTS